MGSDKIKEEGFLFNVDDIVHKLKLITRHLAVLKTLQMKQPMGIYKLAKVTGLPGHQVRSSLRELELEGMIEPSTKGAVTKKSINATLALLKKQLHDVDRQINNIIKTIH